MLPSTTPLALITRVSIGLFSTLLLINSCAGAVGLDARGVARGQSLSPLLDRLGLGQSLNRLLHHSSGPHNTCVYDLKRVIVTPAVYPLTDQLLRRSCGAGRPWAVAADRLLPSSTPLALITRVSIGLFSTLLLINSCAGAVGLDARGQSLKIDC